MDTNGRKHPTLVLTIRGPYCYKRHWKVRRGSWPRPPGPARFAQGEFDQYTRDNDHHSKRPATGAARRAEPSLHGRGRLAERSPSVPLRARCDGTRGRGSPISQPPRRCLDRTALQPRLFCQSVWGFSGPAIRTATGQKAILTRPYKAAQAYTRKRNFFGDRMCFDLSPSCSRSFGLYRGFHGWVLFHRAIRG